MTDVSGNIVQSYAYDSFGNILSTGNQNFVQPYTYTGREYDPKTGFYFYRARYYNPMAGRFISEDPIRLKGGDYNLYRYVKNNPVNCADPEGLTTCSIGKRDLNECLNACAMGEEGLRNFCRSLPDPRLRAGLMHEGLPISPLFRKALLLLQSPGSWPSYRVLPLTASPFALFPDTASDARSDLSSLVFTCRKSLRYYRRVRSRENLPVLFLLDRLARVGEPISFLLFGCHFGYPFVPLPGENGPI